MLLFKILQWVQFIVQLILEAEEELGAGAGEQKKLQVMTAATGELNRIGLAPAEGPCTVEALVESASGLVDGIVAVLNCVGVFRRG